MANTSAQMLQTQNHPHLHRWRLAPGHAAPSRKQPHSESLSGKRAKVVLFQNPGSFLVHLFRHDLTLQDDLLRSRELEGLINTEPDQRNPNISKELLHWTADCETVGGRSWIVRSATWNAVCVAKAFASRAVSIDVLRHSSGIRHVAGEKARHASTAGHNSKLLRTS